MHMVLKHNIQCTPECVSSRNINKFSPMDHDDQNHRGITSNITSSLRLKSCNYNIFAY